MNPGKRRKLAKLEFLRALQLQQEVTVPVVVEEVKEVTQEPIETVVVQEELVMDNPIAQLNKKKKKTS